MNFFRPYPCISGSVGITFHNSRQYGISLRHKTIIGLPIVKSRYFTQISYRKAFEFSKLRFRNVWKRPVIARSTAARHSKNGFQTMHHDNVILSIIAANVLVWALWQTNAGRTWMPRHFLLSSENLRHGRLHTLVTSFFSHVTVGHLASNMVVLYFFASPVIASLGVQRFLQMYMVGGLVSSFAGIAYQQIIPRLSIPASMWTNPNTPSLGASGAVNATVMAAICLQPTSVVYLYMLVPIPAALFGIGYVLKDAVGAYFGGSQIGHAAHLAGAAVGCLYFLAFKRRMF